MRGEIPAILGDWFEPGGVRATRCRVDVRRSEDLSTLRLASGLLCGDSMVVSSSALRTSASTRTSVWDRRSCGARPREGFDTAGSLSCVGWGMEFVLPALPNNRRVSDVPRDPNIDLGLVGGSICDMVRAIRGGRLGGERGDFGSRVRLGGLLGVEDEGTAGLAVWTEDKAEEIRRGAAAADR